MNIYISGPISGMPEQNRPAFVYAARVLNRRGHGARIPHSIAPWQHEGDCPPGYTKTEHSSACYLRGDLFWLIESADAIFMLRGWELSIGARLEHEVASRCGLPVYYQDGPLVPLLQSGDDHVSRTLPYDGPPLRGDIGHPPVFKGDASRLFERRYEDD